jgi:hypothetical protein
MEETLKENKLKTLPQSEQEDKENESIQIDSKSSDSVTMISSKNQLSLHSPLQSQNLNQIKMDEAPNIKENIQEKSIEHSIKKNDKNEDISKYSEESEGVISKMHSKKNFLNGTSYLPKP